MELSVLGTSQIMFHYIVHPQYFKVQHNVCVISWLFKLILHLIILCLCFLSILVLYVSLVHMIDRGYAVAQMVEALSYKPEGCRFNSRWCHWNSH